MKSVLITGGTVRLGKAIAERLRAEGWRVITSSHRPDAGADIVADLAEPMGAAKLYAATLQMLGGMPPDALVNNAALFTGDEAAIRAVNLEAPKKLTMLMAGRETGVGAVVNILDAGASDSRRSCDSSRAASGYLASKRELAVFTRSAAATFAGTLRVNAVAPGPALLEPLELPESLAAASRIFTTAPTPASRPAISIVSFFGASRLTAAIAAAAPVKSAALLTSASGGIPPRICSAAA